MRLIGFVLTSLAAYAQPTVTSCAASSIEHTSAIITCTVSTGSQNAYVKYGTSTGVYGNRTKSVLLNDATVFSNTALKLALGGLTPATTYYVQPCARPNANNTTSEGCATEFTFATLAAPTVDPPFPTAPTIYYPSAPDVSGYTVVTIKRCSSGYPCANGAVGPHSNEDSLQTVLNNATYGTVIRFPVGLDVNVEHVTGAAINAGYTLPAKAVQAGKSGIDDATHDWIVIEGAGCASSSDFPPYGSRIDTTYSGKLPILRATLLSNTGEHFYTSNAAAHHYIIRCLELGLPAGSATDVVNPTAYQYPILLSQDVAPVANLKYFVLDRLLINGVGGTKRLYGGIYTGAPYTAIVGCDVRVGIWSRYSFPTGSPTVGGTGNRTLTIPSGTTYQLRSTDAAQGMASGGSAVVTSAGASGNWALTLGAGGGVFRYDSRAISSVSCTNCTSTGAAADPLASLPANEYLFTYGSVDNTGAITVTFTVNSRDYYGAPITPGGNTSQLAFGIQGGYYNPGPLTIENTYVENNGIGFYVDGGYLGSTYDTTGITRRSWFNTPKSRHWNNASSDGYKYANRQHWEIKRGQMWLIQGNLFSGQFSYQNTGPSIFLSGRGTYTSDPSQISDIWIRSNTIAHGPMGWECSGNIYASSDPAGPMRVLFENNLLYDLNRFVYDNSGPGALNSGYFTSMPGCQSVRYRNNTHGQVAGLAPVVMFHGGDDIRGGRLEYRDNLLYYGQGDTGCSRYGVGFDDTPLNATYPRLPALTGTTTATARLDSFWAKIGAGVTTPNHNITNNLIIGGRCSADGVSYSDLSSATVTTVSADFPSGQIWPSGSTVAARESAAGVTNSATYNYRLTGTYARASADKFSPIGANLDTLLNEQGVVRDIAITAGATHIIARYTAPDSRACRFDVSSDSGATWSSVSDSGGGQRRSAAVTGLTTSTAYTWRLLCYFAQTNDGRQWDDWSSDRITTGSVSTAATSGGTRNVYYVVPSGIGATKIRVTSRLASGSTETPVVCTSSPCSVTFGSTSVSYRIDYLNSSDAAVAVGDWQKL